MGGWSKEKQTNWHVRVCKCFVPCVVAKSVGTAADVGDGSETVGGKGGGGYLNI